MVSGGARTPAGPPMPLSACRHSTDAGSLAPMGPNRRAQEREQAAARAAAEASQKRKSSHCRWWSETSLTGTPPSPTSTQGLA